MLGCIEMYPAQIQNPSFIVTRNKRRSGLLACSLSAFGKQDQFGRIALSEDRNNGSVSNLRDNKVNLLSSLLDGLRLAQS